MFKMCQRLIYRYMRPRDGIKCLIFDLAAITLNFLIYIIVDINYQNGL